MKHLSIAFMVLLSTSLGAHAADKSLSDLPQRALAQSEITSSGSQPFHLHARVTEATNPDNEGFDAEIDEYWMAPDKWRRTVKSEAFSEVIVVNGDRTSDQVTGDHSPNWLRTLLNAMFDPGAQMRGIDMTLSSDNPMIGGTQTCRRFAKTVGEAPAVNRVFSSFCFESGLLDWIGVPGYHAEYKDYRKFGNKTVARRIRENLEPGTELEASITELSAVNAPDEAMFVIDKPTPLLQTTQVSEETLRKLADAAPPMQWPAVKGGKVAGVLSIYVCLDRQGHVRETFGLNSDHPMMTDAAREQVLGWRFKPAVNKGSPVQVEGILTFAYQTHLDPKDGK